MALTKGLVIYPRGEGGDANYFKLLARRFKNAHREAEIHLENFGEYEAAEFQSDLKKSDYTNLDIFAYIGHGGTNNLYSADVGRNGRAKLATRLSEICNDDAVILLYACNCGNLGDSMLGYLYRHTLEKRFTFYGHHSAGRAGNNPDKTVYPPSDGAKLIEHVMGPLAKSPRLRAAWRATFGNEQDDLWATFFLLSHEDLIRRACKPALAAAGVANNRRKREVGWEPELNKIYPYLGVSVRSDEELALGVARWQAANMKPADADGILGRMTWAAMQPKLANWAPTPPRDPNWARYGPNP
jgi:hypothetical protein